MTTSLVELHTAAAACAATLEKTAAGLTDDALIDSQRQLAAILRIVETAAAGLAAQVAHRSRRELGYDGLAQRRGARTPEALVQQVTGTSGVAARRLVRVGSLVAARLEPTPTEPWLAAVLAAAATGAISLEGVDVIRAGLGSPTATVSADALADAARELARLAPTATVDRLAARARELRDDLDAAGVAAREAELRDRRYLRMIPQLDGMTRVSGLLDPESAAIIGAAVDAATSPRRGGPRFVDPTRAAEADALVADSRTIEQIVVDTLVELVDSAQRGDTSRLGARRADVRVVVAQADLDRRSGVGHLEGQAASVSVESVERMVCDGGLTPVLFDSSGAVLDLGRTQRLHSVAQRIAISTRDGGCILPGCDRPPSWCEVHHIREFSRGGPTSVDDGVLLCRHHHMLMHNNAWRIDRREKTYWLVPPETVDPRREPVLLETKSRTVRRMLATG
ncbi:HNH endonuclease signature motif containing protein [soil metagenome]